MYRNISYYIESSPGGEKQGMVKLDTWDENGERITEEVPAYSTLYYEDSRGTDNSMFSTKLKKKVFKTTYDRFNWMKEDSSKRYFECLPPTKEFLFNKYKGAQETHEFSKYKLRTHFTDIEIAVQNEFPEPWEAKYPINVITVYDSLTKLYNVWYLTNDDVNFENTDTTIYNGFTSEHKMLNAYMDWYTANRADVMAGWNVLGFDMPYLVNRINKKCKRGNEFSPIGKMKEQEMKPKEKNFVVRYYSIEGLSVLDQLLMYRDKFVFAKKSQYTLDNICSIELGSTKLEFEGSMKDLWQNDFEHWVKYNIRDVELCVKLEDKLGHIDLARMMCNMGLCEYDNIYKTAPYILGSVVLQGDAMDKKVVTRVERDVDKADFTGAFVFPTQAGVYHRGVTSVDLNSLYPNIMITLNISPETKLGIVMEETDEHVVVNKVNGQTEIIDREKFDNLLEHNLTKAANGVLYYKHHIKQGILPTFLERVYNSRQEDRAKGFEHELKVKELTKELEGLTDPIAISEMKAEIERNDTLANFLDTSQMAKKILINSLYGSLGSIYFPLFDLDNAEAVTLTGQLINKSAAKFVTAYAKKYYGATEDVLIYGDTDSVTGDTKIKTKQTRMRVTTSEGKIMEFSSTDLLTVERNGVKVDILGIELEEFDKIEGINNEIPT
jgi:DNA polymerase elongation subunit (family B)